MKKLIAYIVAVLLLVTFTPLQSKAEKNPISISNTEKKSAEVQALINRVNEINAMDRSTMSRAERKAIRKELREIKREVNRRHGGVYVSTGIIILILVLIIVF